MKVVKLVMKQPTSSSPSSSSSSSDVPKSTITCIEENLSATSSSFQRVLKIKEDGDNCDDSSTVTSTFCQSGTFSSSASSSFDASSSGDQGNIKLQQQQKLNQGKRKLKKETIQAMLKKESTTYKSYDYFHTMQPKNIYIYTHENEVGVEGCDKDDTICSKSLSSITTTTTDLSSSSTPPNTPPPPQKSGMDSPTSVRSNSDSAPMKKRRYADAVCRDKICEWTYRLINFFNVNRETVYFTMSYLDRFLMSYKVDRYTYKILATTSLLLALKVHQPRKLILKNVIEDLSKGEFDMDDVDRTELMMLKTLSWSLHPPSPMDFVSRLIEYQLPLIAALNHSLTVGGAATSPSPTPNATESNGGPGKSLFFNVDKVQAHAIFFVELSVFDYYFVTQKPSVVALAAILNTIEGLGLFQKISLSTSSTSQSRQLFYRIVLSIFDLVQVNIGTTMGNGDDGGISVARSKLWGLYETSEEGINAKKTLPDSSAPLFCRRGGEDRKELSDNTDDLIFGDQNGDQKSRRMLAPRSVSFTVKTNNDFSTI